MSSIISGITNCPTDKGVGVRLADCFTSVCLQSGNEDVGDFQAIVVPRPGHTLTELENAVDQVISKFINEGPTADELQRAKAGLELGFLRGLESNLGKADQLLDGAVFHGDAGYYSSDYQKTLAVTAADVKRVAAKYLAGNRIVLSVVPKGKRDAASKSTESETVSLLLSGAKGER